MENQLLVIGRKLKNFKRSEKKNDFRQVMDIKKTLKLKTIKSQNFWKILKFMGIV